MRPLHVVLDQIRWDTRFAAARFRVRWQERDNAKLREEALASFLARRDVPHHRVRALVCDDRVVWSRDDGTDLVAAAALTGDPIVVGSVGFWNVLDDPDAAADEAGESDAARVVANAAFVASAVVDGDVFGVVEASAAFLTALRTRLPAGRCVIDEGSVAVVVTGSAADWQVQPLPLPGRNGLLLSRGDLAVAVAHLTSSVRGDRQQRRHEQRTALAAALPRTGRLLVVLDCNSEGELAELDALGLKDAARTDGVDADAGPTWRSDDGARPPRRIDRIYSRGFVVDEFRVDRTVAGSDHWPLCARLATPAPTPRLPVRTNVRRAVCIVPPPAVAERIDVIRRAHDANVDRWPAHINLAFPFVDDDANDAVVAALARALVSQAPFSLRLGPTAIFGKNHRAATIDDDGACARLMTVIDALCMAAPRDAGPRTAHLSLTTDGTSGDLVEAVVGVSFDVDHVVVIEREEDGPFVVVERLAFGACSLHDAVTATGLCDLSPAGTLAPGLRARLDELPGTWELVGSSARGVRFIDSDADVAWSPPAGVADPLALALSLFGGERVDALAAPRIKTTIEGVEVDIVVGADDARQSARQALSTTQTEALRALRLWARLRGLRPADGNGMPSSAAWLGLILEGGEASPEELLCRAWRRLADEDDVAAVSGTGFRGVTPRALARLRREARRALDFVDDEANNAAWRSLFGVQRPEL